MSSSKTETALKQLLQCVVEEMRENPSFEARVAQALSTTGDPATPRQIKAKRRNPALLNPIQMILDGEELLKRQLCALSVDQLKDIVAEYGMDNAKLAMKWKKPERLIALIIESAQRRSTKGDAFREV